MPFPETPREIYDVNPLNEVICQLRFPPILKIVSETPSQFQDAVRAKYSTYSTNSNPPGLGLSGLGLQMPPEIADALKSVPLFAMGGVAEHHFSVDDESRLISLAQEFIALTDRQYSRWEGFRAELVSMTEVFSQVYEPGPFNRIGLRYVDVLMRSRFGMPDTAWSEFLNPSFIGLLGDQHVANDVRDLVVDCTLTIPDVEGGRVHIKHGLRRTENENEQVYLIDADFHTSRRSDKNGVFEILDKFNQWSGRLFRWATTERLRDSLGRNAA